MVSKVAVIALVAIVACPILLGYAMNIDEVTIIDYAKSNDPVNVTPLLQNDVEYTTVLGDIYELNTNFYTIAGGNTPTPILPVYTTVSTNTSSLPIQKYVYTNGEYPTVKFKFSLIDYIYMEYNYNTSYDLQFKVIYYDDESTFLSVDRLHSMYWDKIDHTLYYSYYNPAHTIITAATLDINEGSQELLTYKISGTYQGIGFLERWHSEASNSYADFSSGFYFFNDRIPYIKMADGTKSSLMTINLDSITDSNYTCDIMVNPNMGGSMGYRLVKTTNDGVVNWKLYYGYSFNSSQDLYYNPSRNDNTYQLNLSMDIQPYSNSHDKATLHANWNYVGGWPTVIGAANVYLTYSPNDYSVYYPINTAMGISSIGFENATNNKTPVIRMDRSTIDGYEIPIISNQTYAPASFKNNPATTIKDISLYGNSITFGGNTYTVDSKGNITLGTHKVPINGIVLDSVPISGGYENRINGNVISTTVQPSDIAFNGKWSASVSTESMESTTYTETQWVAGSFGWDGLDHNFLIVGLLTSLGAFIALGIYIRRTKANLWPLLLVCGGAAMLFFCML